MTFVIYTYAFLYCNPYVPWSRVDEIFGGRVRRLSRPGREMPSTPLSPDSGKSNPNYSAGIRNIEIIIKYVTRESGTCTWYSNEKLLHRCQNPVGRKTPLMELKMKDCHTCSQYRAVSIWNILGNEQFPGILHLRRIWTKCFKSYEEITIWGRISIMSWKFSFLKSLPNIRG